MELFQKIQKLYGKYYRILSVPYTHSSFRPLMQKCTQYHFFVQFQVNLKFGSLHLILKFDISFWDSPPIIFMRIYLYRYLLKQLNRVRNLLKCKFVKGRILMNPILFCSKYIKSSVYINKKNYFFFSVILFLKKINVFNK